MRAVGMRVGMPSQDIDQRASLDWGSLGRCQGQRLGRLGLNNPVGSTCRRDRSQQVARRLRRGQQSVG
jgi:hypothetical protein